jgi:two-component system LytT family response regulator
MIRTLIVDDEAPARAKLRLWLRDQPDIEIAQECSDGVAAAHAIMTGSPDLVFLDIQMPGLSGMEVAAQLDPATAPLLVFVTAFDAHAVAAFDMEAVDYVLKPYDKSRFRRALDRVRARLDRRDVSGAVLVARRQTGPSSRLLVPEGEGLRLIDCVSIHALEADDNYVNVHTAKRTYMLRRTLQDLLLQLGDGQFIRIHKSAAVNISEIDTLTPLFKGDYEVRLRSGRCLRLSRRYTENLFSRTGL